MSGLRYALEALCEYAEASTKDTRPRDKHGPIGRKPVPRLTVDEIRKLLAAHPVEHARPLLDREDVEDAIRDEFLRFGAPEVSDDARRAADAVMELARPMPTQAELAEWLRETFTADPGGTSWDLAAECILIALNGAE